MCNHLILSISLTQKTTTSFKTNERMWVHSVLPLSKKIWVIFFPFGFINNEESIGWTTYLLVWWWKAHPILLHLIHQLFLLSFSFQATSSYKRRLLKIDRMPKEREIAIFIFLLYRTVLEQFQNCSELEAINPSAEI